jgi:hypothetical protein
MQILLQERFGERPSGTGSNMFRGQWNQIEPVGIEQKIYLRFLYDFLDGELSGGGELFESRFAARIRVYQEDTGSGIRGNMFAERIGRDETEEEETAQEDCAYADALLLLFDCIIINGTPI